MEENKSLQDMINKYSKDLMEYYRNIKKNNTAVETATVSISSVNEKETEETLVEEKNRLPEKNDIEKESDTNINNTDQQPEIIETNDVTAKELYDEFKKENNKTGFLKVQALTARQTFPVTNAKVYIIKTFGNDKGYLITTAETDESGLTPEFELPAVAKEKSETPGSENPFTTYTIIVEHPDFVTMKFENVPVFEDVLSIQTANMVLKTAATPYELIINVEEEKPDIHNDQGDM